MFEKMQITPVVNQFKATVNAQARIMHNAISLQPNPVPINNCILFRPFPSVELVIVVLRGAVVDAPELDRHKHSASHGSDGMSEKRVWEIRHDVFICT